MKIAFARKATLTAILLGGTLAAPAQAGVFPYAVHSRALDNGLVVHVIPMSSPGVASYYTWMAVGSRDEVDPGRTGFAHFFEHLMFYGTEALGSEARERAVLTLGAEENAWTWFDETVYHATLPASELDALVEMEADRFQHLHLTEDMVKKESGAVYGEYRKGQADPDNKISEVLWATAFTTHTYGHDTIGYEADIKDMPSAHTYAQAFFDRYYRPENATLLVVGDVDPDQVFARVGELYAGWERASVARAEIPAEPPQEGPRNATIEWTTPTAPRLAFGWKTPAANPDDAESAALELASQVLFAPIGPLRRRLVEGEAIAYDVTGGRYDLVDPGLLQITVTVKDEASLARAEQIVREEVAALHAPLDDATLDATRSHARYAFLTSLDDPEAVADALGWAIRRGGGPDAIDRFYARYDALTAADVAAAAAKYLVDTGLTVATLRYVDPGATDEAPAPGATEGGGAP